MTKIAINVQQITKGDFDVNDLLIFSNSIIVTRADMNHASEIFFRSKEKLGNKLPM
jgi:hypothetical protein